MTISPTVRAALREKRGRADTTRLKRRYTPISTKWWCTRSKEALEKKAFACLNSPASFCQTQKNAASRWSDSIERRWGSTLSLKTKAFESANVSWKKVREESKSSTSARLNTCQSILSWKTCTSCRATANLALHPSRAKSFKCPKATNNCSPRISSKIPYSKK